MPSICAMIALFRIQTLRADYVPETILYISNYLRRTEQRASAEKQIILTLPLRFPQNYVFQHAVQHICVRTNEPIIKKLVGFGR